MASGKWFRKEPPVTGGRWPVAGGSDMNSRKAAFDTVTALLKPRRKKQSLAHLRRFRYRGVVLFVSSDLKQNATRYRHIDRFVDVPLDDAGGGEPCIEGLLPETLQLVLISGTKRDMVDNAPAIQAGHRTVQLLKDDGVANLCPGPEACQPVLSVHLAEPEQFQGLGSGSRIYQGDRAAPYAANGKCICHSLLPALSLGRLRGLGGGFSIKNQLKSQIVGISE